jgi:putative ABC transport system ATP-binding protein
MFSLSQVRHRYGRTIALELPHFEGAQGEQYLVLGPSGSGKTTLLHVMAGLVRPTEGTVVIAGQDLADCREAALDRFRGQHIGIVFQRSHLLPTLTVEENLLMAQYLAGLDQVPARAQEVLRRLDVADTASAYPSELSTGEQQRVGIARAVMNRLRVLLADEPTSSLDDERAEQVIDLLTTQAWEDGATLVITTHDKRVQSHMPHQRTLTLEDA